MRLRALSAVLGGRAARLGLPQGFRAGARSRSGAAATQGRRDLARRPVRAGRSGARAAALAPGIGGAVPPGRAHRPRERPLGLRARRAAPAPPRRRWCSSCGPGEALAGGFQGQGAPDGAAIGAALGPAIAEAARAAPMDTSSASTSTSPSTPPARDTMRELVSALRTSVPAAFVSISVRALPNSDDERKQVAPLFAAADALVAFVFGPGPRVDPVVDGRPAAALVGRLRHAGERDAARSQRRGARQRSGVGSRRALRQPAGRARERPFRQRRELHGLHAHGAGTGQGRRADARARRPDRLSDPVRQRDAVSARLEHGGQALRPRARHPLRGRRGSGTRRSRWRPSRTSCSGGRSRRCSRAACGRRAATPSPWSSSNRSHHASVVSRVANWIEVDLAPARPADVQLGGFDRYEVYDAAGRPVTPGARHPRAPLRDARRRRRRP